MAAVLVVLAGCSDDSGVSKGSSVGSTTSVGAATVPEATTTAPGPTTTIDVGLPPVDPAVVGATKTAIAAPATDRWLSSALAVTAVPDNNPCSQTPPTMEPEVATNVIAIGDVVLSELLVNLDSALGGLQLACTASETATAASELADAKAAANAISARIEELNR